MKARGIRGGILLSPEPGDTLDTVQAALVDHRDLLGGQVSVEVPSRLSGDIIEAIREAAEAAGGRLGDVRPPTNAGLPASAPPPRGETVILVRTTVRSGARIESSGSVVILGDVNAGAEILAADDIIVIGTLRGLAHAGAGGNAEAFIWAQQIRSPQLRIGPALAQSGGDANRSDGPEVAHLKDGQIVLRPYSH